MQLKLWALGEFPAVLAWLLMQEALQAKMAPGMEGQTARGGMAQIQALRSSADAKRKKLFSHSVLKCSSSRQLILEELRSGGWLRAPQPFDICARWLESRARLFPPKC